MFYTGGTTGFPKGVMLTHNSVTASSMALIGEGLAPKGGRMLIAAPLFHIAGWCVMITTLMRGNTQVLMPMFNSAQVLEVIEKYRITDTMLVPTMIQMLLEQPEVDSSDLSSLARMLYGASPMPQSMIELVMQKMPDVELMQAYGMTEASPLITLSGPENHTREGVKSGRVRSAGRAGILQEIRIVDEDGNDVPQGGVGQVLVRGANIMTGYWGNPGGTAKTIVDGWMHTGDGGLLDEDGYLYIVDRLKDMIISGGENIYSTEVENAVIAHDGVAQCAAIGIPDKDWGEIVHVVIVPATGAEPTLQDIKNHCKQLVAGFKCPRSISLANSLPVSGAGKVLKTELRKPFWADHDASVDQ
ncbi:MAG: AMP-binding protein [Haliea sp.]